MVKVHCVLVVLTVALITQAEEKYDLFDLAHDVAKKELGDEWPKFLAKAKERYEDRSRQGDVSLNSFLNTVVLDVGSGAKGGGLEDLKKLVNWIALYKEWGREEGGLMPPEWLRDAAFEHSGAVMQLKDDFSWDKLKGIIQAKIKEKEDAKKKKEKEKDNK